MIKLLIMDCDGVLTDGRITYREDSCEIKSFSAYDGMGIKLLKNGGIRCAVLTGRECKALTRRCRELKIDYLYQNVDDKAEIAEDIIKELNIGWENVAFIGDDWNDYILLQKAGLSAVPNQAFPQLKKIATLVTDRKGGDGAVREFIEHILVREGLFEKAIEKYVKDDEK